MIDLNAKVSEEFSFCQYIFKIKILNYNLNSTKTNHLIQIKPILIAHSPILYIIYPSQLLPIIAEIYYLYLTKKILRQANQA